jgi:hypothetical protein
MLIALPACKTGKSASAPYGPRKGKKKRKSGCNCPTYSSIWHESKAKPSDFYFM